MNMGFGHLEIVKSLLNKDPSLIHQTTVYDRHSPLHIAAANGQIKIVCLLLKDGSVNPDCLNRHKQVWYGVSCFHLYVGMMIDTRKQEADLLK
ncbi:putative ankyrin repeat-containing domain-containing protein [Helianthus annuus]|uniref:Ankyrin repeat-containing domain-containing protein n=1 Tax=Helianthus annuus TaxID=4232 RepID=A0A9K3HPP7_HELAN|nr:putative ankyrin repeat-containing domain-containing protein [Helianthus annuus]KAJ0509510.1 putative ankyrin repeat-containing domain-containing protein [Helianthus annuus]KAJ0517562.1 putative ankyrin repeat-containing domain-containing protein [Helianthus annuus]KAJ0638437.1 putative ankyrin repeat-containing domain-containing protein [Helianthus annuus]KAJ0685572.1 putative ankyrin repeat-containing domain-containing protein [Helianthus annuus]